MCAKCPRLNEHESSKINDVDRSSGIIHGCSIWRTLSNNQGLTAPTKSKIKKSRDLFHIAISTPNNDSRWKTCVQNTANPMVTNNGNQWKWFHAEKRTCLILNINTTMILTINSNLNFTSTSRCIKKYPNQQGSNHSNFKQIVSAQQWVSDLLTWVRQGPNLTWKKSLPAESGLGNQTNLGRLSSDLGQVKSDNEMVLFWSVD